MQGVLFKKKMIYIKRFWLIIFVLAIIAFLTFQSHEETLRLSYGMQYYFKLIIPNASGRWTVDMHWFRTLLHVPLYFVLGISAGFCIKNSWKAIGICSLVALSDETLKIFLPTREFQAIDLGFDAIGFLMGIVVVLLLRQIKRVILKSHEI